MDVIAKCVRTRKQTNRNIILQDYGTNALIYNHIHRVIGYPAEAKIRFKNDKKAMEMYEKLEAELFDHMVDNYAYLGYEFNPESYMNSVENYIQKVTGARFKNAAIRNSRTLMNVASRLIDDMNSQREAFDKLKIPRWQRLVLPPDISARKYDRFGIMSQLINFGGKLIEIKREANAKFLERLETASNKFIETLKSRIPPLITEEYLMGGVDMRVETTTIWNRAFSKLIGKEVIGEITAKFMGSEKTADGGIIHKFKYEQKSGEWKEFTLTEDDISTEEIRDAVIDAYANKLINKLGHGQTRYIEWHSPAEHLGKNEKNDPEVRRIFNILIRASIKHKNKWTSPEFHYVTKNGVTYRYVMLKGPEGDPRGEVYKAFIISHKTEKGEEQFYYNPIMEKDKKSRLKESALRKKKLHDPREVGLEDGFYTSDTQSEFGNHVGFDDATKTWSVTDYKDKAYYHFYRMPVQPHPSLIRIKPSDSGAIQHNNLWETLAEYRMVLKDYAEFVKKKIAVQHKFLTHLLQGGRDSRLFKVLRDVMPDNESVINIIKVLTNMTNINSNVYVSKSGVIHTPDGSFETISQNYWPTIYEDHVYLRQLRDYMDKLLTQIEVPAEDVDVEALREEYKILESIYRLKTNDYDSEEERTKLTLAKRTGHLKHRSKYTDPTERRMDGGVLSDYIENTTNSLVLNDYMNMLLDVVYKLAKTATVTDKLPMLYIESAVNRVKINTHDPTMLIKGAEWLSPTHVANGLNKIKIFGTGWRAIDVMDMIKRVRALLTESLLRTSTAIINRTQVINIAINLGVGNFLRVSKEIKKDKWQVLCSRYGINDPLSFVEAYLTGGGGPTRPSKDMGTFTFPGFRVPIPFRPMLDYLTMAMGNRRKAIKEGLPALDEALEEIEMDRLSRIKSISERIAEKELILKQRLPLWKQRKIQKQLNVLKREQKRTSSELHKRKIEDLRESFLDLVLTPKKDANRRALEAKIKKIYGDISNARLGRMVEFALSFSFIESLKPWLTLTEGEKEMRQMAAVATLINFMENNLLVRDEGETEITGLNNKGENVKVTVPNILLTQDAFNIARQAVHDTMFNMNPSNLGEMFAGLGGVFAIFKSYTVNQMLFDYEVFKSFSRSGKTHEIPGRVLKAAYQMASMSGKRGMVKYDPSAKNIDHEAVRLLRLILYRLGATVVYETLRSLHMIRAVNRWIPQPQYVLTMTRGMESPLLGLPIRMAIRALALAWTDDKEDDENAFIGLGEDLARLLLPLIFTLPYFTAKEIGKRLSDS